MNIPLDEIANVVRKSTDSRIAFEALRSIGPKNFPSPEWHSIVVPNIEGDIESAKRWLGSNIESYRPTGVYLGLDTLNERMGFGSNVEVGMTNKADPLKLSMDWAWHCEKYGSKHLIRGMYKVRKAYQKFTLGFSGKLLADYLFYFGYSGIVFASAIDRLPVRWNSLFVWGFHDGDLGYLARCSANGIEKLASVG